MAKNWYEPMSDDVVRHKWQAAGDLSKLDEVFNTSDKLTEFLYDTKAVKWFDNNPWPVVSLIASTLIEFKGIFVPGFSFHDYFENQKINITDFHGIIISIIDRLENKWNENV